MFRTSVGSLAKPGFSFASTAFSSPPIFFLTGLTLAVLAASLKLVAVGAPFAPTFLIFSPEPASMRSRLALIFAYKPGLAAITISLFLLLT